MLQLHKPLWAILLPILGGVLTSRAVAAQTLTDAMVSAYLTNPQFRADHARQDALDEDVARAAGGWRPQAVINGVIGRGDDRLAYNYLSPPNHTRENINPQSLSAQIVQPLYDGGKTAADVDRTHSQVKGGRAHADAVEQSVLGDAIQTYYDLYRDQAILELTASDVAALSKVRDATQKLFGIHDVTLTDVGQAEARLARGDAGRAAAEGNAASSVSAFTRSTGLTAGTLPSPPPLPMALMPASLAEATSLALQNPSVREAEQAVTTAQADVDFVGSGLRPSLSLQFSSQYASETSQGRFKQRYNEATANLVIPLYSGGTDYARVREAKSILSQRKFEADEARREATDRVTRAWEQLTSNRARIESLKKQVESANTARNSMEAERRVGSRTILDQLITEQDWLDAQISLVQAQHDEAVATFSVLNAVGRLTARALHLPVKLYDPEEHYRAESGRWIGTDIPDQDDLVPIPPQPARVTQ